MIWFIIKNTFATFKCPQKFFVQTFGGTSFSELLMRIELTDADEPVAVILIFLLNPPLTNEDFGGREFYAIFESFPKQKSHPNGWLTELLMRIELTTSSLPRKCSTPELQQHSSLKERCKNMKQIRINQKYRHFLTFKHRFLWILHFLKLILPLKHININGETR